MSNTTYEHLAYLGVLTDPEFLAHHGILGMHWGIRRFQPYPSDYHGDGKFVGKTSKREARQYTRKLNRLDQDRATVSYFKKSRDKTIANYDRKIKERQSYLSSRNLNARFDKKIAQWTEKKNRQLVESLREGQELQKIKNETDSIIKDLSSKGYTLSSKETFRDMESFGEALTIQMTTGIIGSIAMRALMPNGGFEEGTKYKVKVPKDESKEIEQAKKDAYNDALVVTGSPSANGIKFQNGYLKRHSDNGSGASEAYEKAYREEAEKLAKNFGLTDKGREKLIGTANLRSNVAKSEYDRAKNSDSYQLDFLEMVQNKTWAGANESGKVNKNKMLSEYKEYLNDRDSYWKNSPDRMNKDNVETGKKLYGLSEAKREQANAEARKQSVQNYSRVKSMRNSGMTYSAIANKLGVSESTVWAMLYDEE